MVSVTVTEVRFQVFMALKIEYMDFSVAAPLCGGWIPTFQRTVMPPPSTLVSDHHTTWCNNPENHECHSCYCLV